MSEADIDFRLTKDIDMILILEDKSVEFAKTFWEFIKEGDYKCGWKNSDEMHFYSVSQWCDVRNIEKGFSEGRKRYEERSASETKIRVKHGAVSNDA